MLSEVSKFQKYKYIASILSSVEARGKLQNGTKQNSSAAVNTGVDFYPSFRLV
jgi:hypothetical protein